MKTICDELKQDLPSVSRMDTPQTKEELAKFIMVFEGVCGGV